VVDWAAAAAGPKTCFEKADSGMVWHRSCSSSILAAIVKKGQNKIMSLFCIAMSPESKALALEFPL
jgi:hypothetical protein